MNAEVTVTIAGTVASVDEALTWIVQQLDARPLSDPSASFRPIWVVEDERYYEVTISGSESPQSTTKEKP